MDNIVKVGKRYQIVIPKKIRDKVGIKVTDELFIDIQGGRVVIQPCPRRYSEYMQGLGKDVWSDTDTVEYVKNERESWT